MSAGFLEAEWLEGYNFHMDIEWGNEGALAGFSTHGEVRKSVYRMRLKPKIWLRSM